MADTPGSMRPRRLRGIRGLGAAAAAVAVAATIAACGGGSDDSTTGTSASTPSGGATTRTETPAVAAGRDVFSQNCASCHTLAAAGSDGNVGPNLDELKPDEATVERQVTNGGGGMPAFGGQLSRDQISSVAQYVSSVAGRGG